MAIDRARGISKQREQYVGVWLPEPIVERGDDPAAQATLADDLAIGFLRVLERLQPEERTALLLHDAYDYSHGEVAAILGKSEAAVRQLASRARTRVRQERPRLSIDRSRAQELTDRFLRAVQEANVEELRAILATDVVAIADGGGKVNAGIAPVSGIDRVCRLLVGVQSKYWGNTRQERLRINGLPGIGIFVEERLVGVIGFDFVPDHIRSIYVVVNPDKLPNFSDLQTCT